MKTKIQKLASGVEIVSLAQADGGVNSARVRLKAPIDQAGIRADAGLAERMKAAGRGASLWLDQKAQQKQDVFNYDSIVDVLPQEGDFITVPYRALSKRLVPGHWLDFTLDGVLENAVEMLSGQTLYPNHDFFDINNALGSVAKAEWDGEDKAQKGFPGINALYKIDALMNARIARLLLMKPPGIHSTSLTILFDFDFSHPDLVEEGRFWLLLGQEVGGEIVRLIVTEIKEIWEASLVFQGADRVAKAIGQTETDDDDDETSFSAKEPGSAALQTPPNLNEEKTMKLTKERKAQLGIEFDGEDVPDEQVYAAIDNLSAKAAQVPDGVEVLQQQAAAGKTLLDAKRAEVIAKAKLAELGADEGDLEEVDQQMLDAADADTLLKLEKKYDKRIGERFPNGRSSREDPAAVEGAGGVSTDAKAKETAEPDTDLFS